MSANLKLTINWPALGIQSQCSNLVRLSLIGGFQPIPRDSDEKAVAAVLAVLDDTSKKNAALLGRIQDLTKGGSDKRPPKAMAPRGVRGMFPRKIFNVRASEMAQICLVFLLLFSRTKTQRNILFKRYIY